MRVDKGMILVTGSALLALGSVSLLCCPTARAGSPYGAKTRAASSAAAAPASSEDSLDDDRAEHWAVPAIAREERTQSGVLVVALIGVGAGSARRRTLLKGQKRHG